jgi:hypothetical protein
MPCVLLLGVWNVRNHREVGSWPFSAVEVVNLYWYRAAGAVPAHEATSFDEASLRLTRELRAELTPSGPSSTRLLTGPAWFHPSGRTARGCTTSSPLEPAWRPSGPSL